ncbi:hypothetical protein EDF48_10712 [Curtobacterium sp. PhB191]|nr:hypothetical protein EDF48_10712 [Curtobacterium sp. PhB191]
MAAGERPPDLPSLNGVKRIDRAYRLWAAETIEDTEQNHSEG